MQTWRKRYRDLLDRPEWHSFTLLVKKAKGNRCEECGRDTCEGPLAVHHPFYKKGFLPWQYDIREVRLLCEAHHEHAEQLEDQALKCFWEAYCRCGFVFLENIISSCVGVNGMSIATKPITPKDLQQEQAGTGEQ